MGPVPTIAEKRFDYSLLISWLFLVFVSIDMAIRKTRLRIFIIRWLRRLGMWIRGIHVYRPNLLELNEPDRLQAIENTANNQQRNQNHPHID